MLSKRRKPSTEAKKALSALFRTTPKPEPKEYRRKAGVFDNADFGTQDNLEAKE